MAVFAQRNVNERFKLSAVIYGPHSLKGDGKGPYINGENESSVDGSVAFSIWCWSHADHTSNKPDLNSKAPRERHMILDLSHPVLGSSATALQMNTDTLARFHVFWKQNHETETMVHMDDIQPIGRTVEADRVEMWTLVGGVQYVLQMGPWAMGEFSPRAPINGNGTTKAKITRESEDSWRITASSGSIARLWDYSDVQNPIDKGLYYFDFDVKFTKLK
jgi:hypothetical protein